MSQITDKVIGRWLGTEKDNWHVLNLKHAKVFCDGDIIYSYGYHYALAVRIKIGYLEEFLLNTSKYSNTTSGHQSDVASAISTKNRKMHENFDLIKAIGIRLENYNEVDASDTRLAFLSWFNNTIELRNLPRGKIIFERTNSEGSYFCLYPNVNSDGGRGRWDGRLVFYLEGMHSDFLETMKIIWPGHDPLRSLKMGAISLDKPTPPKSLGVKRKDLKRMEIDDGSGKIILLGAMKIGDEIWCNRGAKSAERDTLKATKIDRSGMLWHVRLPVSKRMFRFEI